jgi:hypothetical protein
MKPQRALFAATWVVITLSMFSPARTSDLRVAAMGQLWLVLNDRDNQLNLYDFGHNPAWLIIDQQQTWLRPGFSMTNSRGPFKRCYDPQQQQDLLATFEGVKVMNPLEVFRGLVGYRNFNLEQVDGAINRNPYQEHPFRLVDNTMGDIHYWGPGVAAQYSRKVFHQKLLVGASLDYHIETGLKDQFPQPRTIYRSAAIGAGIAYRWSDRLSMGATVNYAHNQEYLECLNPSANETRSIEILKFRNENLAVKHTGELAQFLTTQIGSLGLQAQFQPVDFWESALAYVYHTQKLDATESLSQPQKDGIWTLSRFELLWKNRLRFSGVPIRLAFSVAHCEIADYASNPAATIIWGDDRRRENRIGLGLSYEPNRGSLILGVEYYYTLADHSKKDYDRDPIITSGQIAQSEFRLGAEYGLFGSVKLRGGYLVARNIIDAPLLQFSEFLPGHNSRQFTSGLAYTMHAVEVEGYAYFNTLKAQALGQSKKRDSFGIMLTMTIYQN